MKVGLGLGLPFALSKIWSVLSQFIGAATGLVLDPSDNSALFQDSVGTAVTTVGQPNGLVLDERLGLVRGPERAPAVATGNYTTAAGWSIAGGVATGAGVTGSLVATASITSGKWYEASFRVLSLTAGTVSVPYDGFGVQLVSAVGIHTRKFLAQNVDLYVYGSGFSGTVDSFSVKEIPGNHMVQGTAAARPLVNARVNLLTKTTQLDDAAWSKDSASTVVTPLGAGETRIQFLAGSTTSRVSQLTTAVVNAGATLQVSCKIRASDAANIGKDVGVRSQNSTPTLILVSTITLTAAYQDVVISGVSADARSSLDYRFLSFGLANPAVDFTVKDLQLEIGPTVSRYQRVNTATDYDTVGFPQFLTFDGVDDALATGAVTLGANMDCFIAARRSALSDGGTVLSNANTDYLFVTGTATSVASSGAGTPSYAVNGVSVPGGSAASRADLNNAWPLNTWVVIEATNANLSSWTTLGISSYTTARFLCDIGGIVLAPAGDAATRANNRRNLGAKVGLVL